MMNSPNLTTVSLPPAKGRRASAGIALTGFSGFARENQLPRQNWGKLSPQMGRIHRPLKGRPIRDVAERGGRRRLSETGSEPLPATLAGIKARNSSNADADDPTLIEPIQLASA
jgi:hypothetical protein